MNVVVVSVAVVAASAVGILLMLTQYGLDAVAGREKIGMTFHARRMSQTSGMIPALSDNVKKKPTKRKPHGK